MGENKERLTTVLIEGLSKMSCQFKVEKKIKVAKLPSIVHMPLKYVYVTYVTSHFNLNLSLEPSQHFKETLLDLSFIPCHCSHIVFPIFLI